MCGCEHCARSGRAVRRRSWRATHYLEHAVGNIERCAGRGSLRGGDVERDASTAILADALTHFPGVLERIGGAVGQRSRSLQLEINVAVVREDVGVL